MTTPNDNILWQQKKIANPMNLLGRKSKGWAAIAGRRHFILVHTLYRISYRCTLNCKVAAYFTSFLIAPQGHCQTQVLEFDKSKRHAMVSSCHKAGWSNRVWQKLWKPRGCDDPAPAHLTLLSHAVSVTICHPAILPPNTCSLRVSIFMRWWPKGETMLDFNPWAVIRRMRGIDRSNSDRQLFEPPT